MDNLEIVDASLCEAQTMVNSLGDMIYETNKSDGMAIKALAFTVGCIRQSLKETYNHARQ